MYLLAEVPRTGPVPSLEYDLVKGLVVHLCPGLSEADIDAIVKLRWGGRKLPVHTVLEEADLQAMDELVEEGDVEGAKAAFKQGIDLKVQELTRAKDRARSKASSKPDTRQNKSGKPGAASRMGHVQTGWDVGKPDALNGCGKRMR